MTREDIELYVMGQYDGDGAALERAIAEDPALAAMLADEARFEGVLREAAAAATFCPACDDLVRGERCDGCGCALRPGGYTVERVLVSNAHGRMYVARDADGRRVALKELAFVQAPSPSAVAAFEREAKFLRALEHPRIPRFLASFEEGTGVHARYYLAQELVEGEALDRLDDHWYGEDEIVEIARQVLEILVYLQALSPMVIHRDIKPANLLRRKDGTIALVDFGAAHVHGTTAGSTTMGTFGYMPVEQLAGIVDATTDCYALGATLVHLLTRQEPWRLAQSRATINASSELRAFLDKLIAPDPKDRFASAKDALAALDKRHELVRRARRRVPLRALAIAAVALAGGGGVFALVHSRHEAAVPVASSVATLRIKLPPGVVGELVVDGKAVAKVSDGQELPLAAGLRRLRIDGPAGGRCEEPVKLEPGHTTVIECSLQPAAPPQPRLHADRRVKWAFADVKLHDVLMTAADSCAVNMVVPDSLDSSVSLTLSDVPCDQAIEVLLESQSLWYAYDEAANVVRVAPRKVLDRELEEAKWRSERGFADDPLPSGREISLDLKDVPLRNAVAMIGSSAGINVVVPDGIDGRVTVRLVKVPWDHALKAVLAAHELWYRYREPGKILRVAPRKVLDAEAEAGH